MKKPSFDDLSLTIMITITVVAGSLALYRGWRFPEPEPETYIDYCGDSVEKRPDAMQQEGITPLLLPEEDVPKYEDQASWIRPATVEELQIQLRRFGRRTLPSDRQLWIVTTDAARSVPGLPPPSASQAQATPPRSDSSSTRHNRGARPGTVKRRTPRHCDVSRAGLGT